MLKGIRRGLAIIVATIAFSTAGAQGTAALNNQPMFVLPFSNSARAEGGLAVFSLKNLATSATSMGILGIGPRGVAGQSTATENGHGVTGWAPTGARSVGVYGLADIGVGVYGENEGNNNDGVRGVGKRGVRGTSYTKDGAGVMGIFKAEDTTTVGDANLSSATTFFVANTTRGWLGTPKNGVMGRSDVEDGKGVAGVAEGSENSVGVYGASTKGFAAFFKGKVTIQGHLLANTIHVEQINAGKGLIGGAAGKFFKMDHPLDPANKILYHASVESPELKNFYDGVVILDDNGAARIRLPDYFEALNKDFRYQLTCIGSYAPVYIAKEVQKGTFEIAGGRPGMKVSWQVTGVRHDAYATRHPMKVEEAKKPAERGRYLYPVEHGFPDSLGIDYRRDLVKGIEGTKPATVRSRRGTK